MAEAVAAKLAEEAVVGCINQVKHHFRYLSQYHENMANLEANVNNLEKKEVSVRDEVFCALSNAHTIKDGVNTWLGKVKNIKEDAEKILEKKASVGSGCWKGWCVSMRPRYILSKQAMKKTIDLVNFIEEGVFDTVAHPKRHLGYVTSQIKRTTDEDKIPGDERSENSTSQHPATKEEVIASRMVAAGVDEHLESRTLLLNDVMEAVRDPDIRMVRICGMGGIGKTTMAKQVEQMARKEYLFNEIAMVEVNQNPDVKLLQLHIAELLGLTLTEDNVSARARWLGERLCGKYSNVPSGKDSNVPSGKDSNVPNKKILLILDNVWERVDLEKAGIPLQDANSCCKIILTSRNDDVCKGLVHEKEFSVEVLSYQEALTLFHQCLSYVGGYYDKTTAQDLVKECGGLPIAVATIAGAVNNKSEREWKNALRRLQSSDIRNGYAAVFRCLEISYDSLENEKFRKFFRLCCLFSKGSDVSVEELTRYGTALNLFSDPEYLCDAREEAFSYVQTLVHSNLFLRSDRADCLKVHDIVWDFAVSASSSDLFLVNHDSALMRLLRKDSYEDFTSISLLCNKLFQVPEKLSFSNLKLLRLKGDGENCYVESIETFFNEIHGLYVLDIRNMTIPSTLMSIQQLIYLRSLSLARCNFLGGDVSLIGKLNNLEILSFAYSDIMELPIEIKNLKSLRLLDLTKCRICVIAPRVLSELTSLEELYLRGVPLCDSVGSESVFVDIASMSTLVVIDIKIPEDRVQLMNSLFKKLKKFKIFVNAKERTAEDEDQYENRLDIHCDSSILLQPRFTSLLQKATRMKLRVTQLKTLQSLNNAETLVFSELKSLKLKGCDDLVCLVNTMGVLDHNFVSPFRNLKVLDIRRCNKLEHLFTVSAAKGLCILETITVKDCSSLKVIFWKERDDEGNIELPGLKRLFLVGLDNFIGCYNVVDAVDFPLLQEVTLDHLPLITSLIHAETEMSPSGDNETSSHPFFSRKEPDTVCRFPNLRSLKFERCRRLRYLSTPSMAISFREVQKLNMLECYKFQAIVTTNSRQERDDEDAGTQLLLFQKLNLLLLKRLENLSALVPKGYTLKWSSLKTLELDNTGVEIQIETGTIIESQTLLTSLQRITIYGMRSLNFLSRVIPGGFSCEIRDMNVPAHDQLSSVFAPSLIRAFDHLEVIKITKADSNVVFNLEEECSVGGEAEIATLNKLNAIHIKTLHNMTHVWKKVPRNFEGFHNLTCVEVSDCRSLRYLCSPSIAKCLVKLQRVSIRDCNMIEVVSTADEEEGEKEVQKRSDDIVFFPQLQDLKLSYLPCITCINLGVCGSEIFIWNLQMLKLLRFCIMTSVLLATRLYQPLSALRSNCAPLALMRADGNRRSWSFLHLTKIYVYACQNMSTLFPPNIQLNLPVLKQLSIIKCDKLRYIFSSNPNLRSLETLYISDCKMLVVITKDDVEEGGGWSKFVFPTLESVSLYSLPNLEGFCLGNSTFDWPSLTQLIVFDCLKMKIFTSGRSTTLLLDYLFRDSMQHNLAEGGGDINTTLTSAIEKDVDNSNTALREQRILTHVGFIFAGDHLIALCSTWHWESLNGKRYLIRKDVPCLERARPSISTRPVFEFNVKNTHHNDNIQRQITNGPRKYDIFIAYNQKSKSTKLWLQGYDQQSHTKLPLKLALQDIHESYPPEFVRRDRFRNILSTHLNPGNKSTLFIKDIFAREGVEPDIENYFNIWLSAIIPTIKCFDD